MTQKKVMLIIRDGWGDGPAHAENAIANAKTPFHDRIVRDYPTSMLLTDSESVGLPPHTMGNSEVGHGAIGMGRVLYQPLVQINTAIQSGAFFSNKILLSAIHHCRAHTTKLHLIGILQTEGVHGHIDHLFALLELCRQQRFSDVVVHLITDGRDSVPTTGLGFVKQVVQQLKKLGFGSIGSISGRYFAMDRDNRWERTEAAYRAIVEGKSEFYFTDPVEFVEGKYDEEQFDEFIEPAAAIGYKGVSPEDGIIFVNFRTDRPRQLTRALVDPAFEGFERVLVPVHFVGMTEYFAELKAMGGSVAFETISVAQGLGEVVSGAGLRQLRISETEKYPHVTFFFNGQREEPFAGQKNIMIPSPKVATYDLQPEMSVDQIADTLIAEVAQYEYELVIVNLVNADMVGHTGIYEAAKIACEAVDQALQKIVEATQDQGWEYLVCADHGNSEEEYGEHRTTHTLNMIWCTFISPSRAALRATGSLIDIAPTILSLLKVAQPVEITGQSLIIS
jgi:2,3-bisphosphoglycerate-independent phosphoglycerate mutase